MYSLHDQTGINHYFFITIDASSMYNSWLNIRVIMAARGVMFMEACGNLTPECNSRRSRIPGISRRCDTTRKRPSVMSYPNITWLSARFSFKYGYVRATHVALGYLSDPRDSSRGENRGRTQGWQSDALMPINYVPAAPMTPASVTPLRVLTPPPLTPFINTRPYRTGSRYIIVIDFAPDERMFVWSGQKWRNLGKPISPCCCVWQATSVAIYAGFMNRQRRPIRQIQFSDSKTRSCNADVCWTSKQNWGYYHGSPITPSRILFSYPMDLRNCRYDWGN